MKSREKKLLILAIVSFIVCGVVVAKFYRKPKSGIPLYRPSQTADVKMDTHEDKERVLLDAPAPPAFDPFLTPGERDWTRVCIQTNQRDALVSIRSENRTRQKTTDENGRACFDYMARGEGHEAVVSKPGFVEAMAEIHIDQTQEQLPYILFPMELQLLPCQGWELTKVFGRFGRRKALLNGKMVYQGKRLNNKSVRVQRIGRNYLILQNNMNPDKKCRVDIQQREEPAK